MASRAGVSEAAPREVLDEDYESSSPAAHAVVRSRHYRLGCGWPVSAAACGPTTATDGAAGTGSGPSAETDVQRRSGAVDGCDQARQDCGLRTRDDARSG